MTDAPDHEEARRFAAEYLEPFELRPHSLLEAFLARVANLARCYRDAIGRAEKAEAERDAYADERDSYAEDYERWSKIQRATREALGAGQERTDEAAARVLQERDSAIARAEAAESEVATYRRFMGDGADGEALLELARLRDIEAELAEAKERNTMSCENPCGDCAGCHYADERQGEAGER